MKIILNLIQIIHFLHYKLSFKLLLKLKKLILISSMKKLICEILMLNLLTPGWGLAASKTSSGAPIKASHSRETFGLFWSSTELLPWSNPRRAVFVVNFSGITNTDSSFYIYEQKKVYTSQRLTLYIKGMYE